MISVIIPTYNRSVMLLEAIRSIQNQKNSDIEIIVIDDNSTDDTEKIVSKFPCVTYIKNSSNKGPGYSRNLGYRLSKGEYIVFMDDDDYYIDETFYQNAEHILEQNPQIGFVAGYAKYGYTNGIIKEHPLNLSGYIEGRTYLNNFHINWNKPDSTFTSVFRKTVLEAADFCNLQMMNDACIYMNALLYGDAYIMDGYIGIYRIHDTNISKTIGCDFIIDNLKEKEKVFFKMKSTPKSWWYKQFKLTFIYYAITCPSKDEMKKLIRWGIKHYNKSVKLLVYLLYRDIKLLM